MRVSVVITTFNRVKTLRRAVKSVLDQQGVDLELVVVDDGSTDETAEHLSCITDPRVVAVQRDNGGLGAARNTGVAHASGEWIAFLDDDDRALPGWLSTLASMIDEDTGIVSCAAEYRTENGRLLGVAEPEPMGELFANQTALVLAGTFVVRADILRDIGGFDEQLTCSHQTELALRLVPELVARGYAVRTTEEALVRIEARDPDERPMSSPAALYRGVQVLLAKHPEVYARDARRRANSYGVLGVSAVRLGHWQRARSALYSSARAEPRNPRRWLRLATAYCPPLARQVWDVARYRRESSRFLDDQRDGPVSS